MPQTQADNAPRAVIIAGPNGAGKTTFAREFLPSEGHCPTFINADLIAAGLSPFKPGFMALEASRIMLEHVRRRVAAGEDFAIETTLAGRAYLNYIRQWQGLGYRVKLVFLHLPDVELAIQRVRQRVAQGGHNVPEEVICRRFRRGLENFVTMYRPIVDSWQLFDASQWPPVLVDEGVRT
jgi:predicted ABC-type ATPase